MLVTVHLSVDYVAGHRSYYEVFTTYLRGLTMLVTVHISVD